MSAPTSSNATVQITALCRVHGSMPCIGGNRHTPPAIEGLRLSPAHNTPGLWLLTGYEIGTWYTIPEGADLETHAHGLAPDSGASSAVTWPAGTCFRVLRCGSPYLLSITEIGLPAVAV